MDNLEIAKALFGNSGNASNSRSGGQTTTAYGIATSDSVNGSVRVNLGGETTSTDDDQTIEVDTTFAVYEGDEVIVSLVGADGTGKAPCVIGVVGRGDQQQTEINSVTNYVWNDAAGLHVSTEERSVQGANILLDSDSLEIRDGASNSEADQTVYASFGREVTVGNRLAGSAVGQFSQVFGYDCTASGQYSHAEGHTTEAIGEYTHAEGNRTIAEAPGSHVEGRQNHAVSGFHLHVEGYGSTVNGNRTHVEGTIHTVNGNSSHVEGLLNLCDSDNQHVQGICNVKDSNNTYADIIGNGTYAIQPGTDIPYSTSRSNAYNMDWNGNAEFQGEVYVGGCTPNGETPYPVVRYNTSSAQQEYYDKSNSAWTQVPGGGGGGGSSWTLLWTNPNPSSNFAAQTVPIDLSAWSVLCVTYVTATGQSRFASAIVFKDGESYYVTVGIPSTSNNYYYKRGASATNTGVTFTTGYQNTTSGAGYAIPQKIYGVC